MQCDTISKLHNGTILPFRYMWLSSFLYKKSPYDCTLIQSLITMLACTRMHMYVGVWVHTCMKRTKLLILGKFSKTVQQFWVSNRVTANGYNSNFMIWNQVIVTSNLLTHTFTVRYHYSVPIQTIPTLHFKLKFINHYQYFHTIFVKTCRGNELNNTEFSP